MQAQYSRKKNYTENIQSPASNLSSASGNQRIDNFHEYGQVSNNAGRKTNISQKSIAIPRQSNMIPRQGIIAASAKKIKLKKGVKEGADNLFNHQPSGKSIEETANFAE